MSEYPRMVYRASKGAEQIHGVECETMTVADADELDTAKGDGWALAPSDCKKKKK